MRARLVLLLALAVALLAGLPAAPVAGARLAPSAAKPLWPTEAVAGSLLVTTVDERAAAALDGPSFGRVAHVEVAPGAEAAIADALRRRPGVVAVEPDHWRPMLRVPDDPGYGEQLQHAVGRSATAWDVTTGSREVRVAVIDSGIDGTHPDLRPNLVAQSDVSEGFVRTRPLGSDNDSCGAGHGTMVAGVLGAVGNNRIDVAGVAWEVGIIDIAAADASRCSFSDSVLVAALHHAVDQRADVVNMSLGGPADTCLTAMQVAIDDARAAGAVVVAAAGNEQQIFPGMTSVPASCDGVVSVGAVGRDGRVASYSVQHRYLDLVGPGGDPARDEGVRTTAHGGGTTNDYGTSFAAPYVAGVAALLRAVDPGLSADEVEDHLEASTGRSTRSDAYGWGVVDAGRAVAAVRAGTAAPHRVDPRFPVGLVLRVSEADGSTDPIRQAVAISTKVYPDDGALHVVIGRSDDHADALAGSSLGFGAGPLLFTTPTGRLASVTSQEVERVLPSGGRVYLLGGTAALPATLDGELQGLGFDVRRLAGTTREGTASEVAAEIERRLPELGFPPPTRAILATARDWPDAVTAGALGAYFGYPILLTPPGTLHSATRWALARQRPDVLYVVGGTAAVSPPVMEEARQAAGSVPALRMAGVDRFGTAAAVADETVVHMRELTGIGPQFAVAVNLRRADAYTHVLSASPIPGVGSGYFVAVDGEGGTSLPTASRDVACRADVAAGYVAGGADVVSDAVQEEFNRILEDGC